ncbi:acetyl-CoA carboxylase, biotin carboxyl carrier protein, partial [Campylobacter sp. CLAX-7218-21]|nr:acetyl-CoA carboxylase, biotin carboxyl carrier protein [Campylobacter sp. CLAX-7218-21]MEE3712947.1 acetyl-CoA carboxylase, biotin carboxyl carrier protein [Campylobacter sp. CLAX-7218-21]
MTRDEIKELMSFFDETNINKIKIKDGDFVIELEKHE